MITQIAVDQIPDKRSDETVIKGQIEQFLKSDWDACEIDTSHYSSINAVYTAYYNEIKRKSYPCKVARRSNRVFLIREEQK